MNPVYISLGSNLQNPLHQVRSALDALAQLPDTQLIRTSSFYRTPPYGPADQPDFLNAAVYLVTHLSANSLLDHTQRIELEQGRVRKGERWGPRTLDLDIMLFGNLTLSNERLTIPHYDLHQRAFMLIPLLEIAPDITTPDGQPLASALAKLEYSDISYW